MSEITTEEQAQHFLESFSNKKSNETSLHIKEDLSDDKMIRSNQSIID